MRLFWSIFKHCAFVPRKVWRLAVNELVDESIQSQEFKAHAYGGGKDEVLDEEGTRVSHEKTLQFHELHVLFGMRNELK